MIASDTDALRHHQEAVLGVLGRGVAALEGGMEAMFAANAGLREEMIAVLGAYQRFKHERIFDPAIASGDGRRVVLARQMKVACISAGEMYRAHMGKWDRQRIADDWENYRIAARLIANQLRRHVVLEAEGIGNLIAIYS